jgi:hypothetical protein
MISTVIDEARADKHYCFYIETVLFIGLTIFGILEGVHTIWLMAQFGEHPNDPSAVFKGRIHAPIVASFWTVLLCPVFVVFFLKSNAAASILDTAIL